MKTLMTTEYLDAFHDADVLAICDPVFVISLIAVVVAIVLFIVASRKDSTTKFGLAGAVVLISGALGMMVALVSVMGASTTQIQNLTKNVETKYGADIKLNFNNLPSVEKRSQPQPFTLYFPTGEVGQYLISFDRVTGEPFVSEPAESKAKTPPTAAELEESAKK